jgi:glycosyltransferase involved in cell wall biosynthesis
MPKVLLISYLFPPGAGIGSPRALNYARYLPQYGCEVSVLTARFATTAYNDPRLLDLIPPGTKVYRAFNPEIPYRLRDRVWKKVAPPRVAAELADAAQPKGGALAPAKRLLRAGIERVATPDIQNAWSWFATRRALSLIERHRYDAVLMNIPPYSTMKIGVAIKRRFPHVRLISDIRDDWVGYYLPLFDAAASESKRRLAVTLERQLMEASDFVSSVTPAQRQAIRERYPDQPEAKFFCTPNGYSPDVFRSFKPRPHEGSGLVMTYFGSVYGNPVYSPKLYLDAVDSLPSEVRPQLETRFIGRIAAEALPTMEGRSAPLHKLGFMPQSEGLRYLEETDYLLLIARDPTTHAGKLFDYLATGKPILALTPPEGEIARIIRDTASGWVIDPANLDSVRQGLLDAWQRFQTARHHVTPNRDAVEAFSWPHLSGHLARYTGLDGSRR